MSLLLRPSPTIKSQHFQTTPQALIYNLTFVLNISSYCSSTFLQYSCRNLPRTYSQQPQDNISSFTDTHLFQLYQHLQTYNIEIDNSFHQIIAPISLQYLKTFNREQGLTMFKMLQTILQLKIDNPALKAALLNKLDNENCYRYIPLYESSILLNKLLNSQDNSKLGLTSKLIAVVHQHQKYYNYFSVVRPVITQILKKLENLKRDQPQLTEAYKQLK